MSLRKIVKLVLPVLILVVTGTWMYDLMNTESEGAQLKLEEKIWQVDVMPVTMQTLSPSITLYGRVESPELLQAAAPGTGIVETVAVRAGAAVSKGQILVKLDRRDFDSIRLQAEAELNNIKSQVQELKIRHRLNQESLKTEEELLKLAEEEVKRMQQLKNQNLGSDSALNQASSEFGRQQLSLRNRLLEVESFPAKLTMLEAQQSRYRARTNDAQLMIERSEVTAPFDGVVSTVPISVGDQVSSGETLISIYPSDTLEVRAHIPAKYINSIQEAFIRNTPLMAKLAIDQQTVNLELKRLAGEAEVTGIDAYFHTGELSSKLRPGELLSIELSLPARENVVAIPFQAIYGNSRVYLMKEGRLMGLDVETVGQYTQTTDRSRLLISSPALNENDLIVITHLPNAVTGLKVRSASHDTIE